MRTVPVQWPVSAQWGGTGVYVGPTARRRRSGPPSPSTPLAGTIVGLRAGTATVTVTVNGETGRPGGRPSAGHRRPALRRAHGVTPMGVFPSRLRPATSADRLRSTETLKDGFGVDLFEYQARGLFAKHGVPVLAGVRASTRPDEAPQAPQRSSAAAGRRQGAGEDRRPRQGRRRQARRERPTRPSRRPRAILGMDIKGHTVGRRHGRPGLPTSPRSTTSPSCSTAPNRTYLAMRQRRGRHGDRAAGWSRPARGARPASRSTPIAGRRRRPRPRDRRRPPAFAGRAARPGRPTSCRSCGRSSPARTPRWSRSTRWSSRRRRPGHRARRQGLASTRTPSSGTRSHAALEDKGAADPLEAKAKENGPQLRQARRRGRHHRQRRGPGHVARSTSSPTPARTHGGVKPANFLDIGGGASAEVMANGLDDHPGRPAGQVACSSTSSAASPPATRSPRASSARSPRAGRRGVTKPLVVRLDGNNVEVGRADPARRQPPARHAAPRPWTARADKAAELAERLRGQRSEQSHVDLPEQGLQDHRPGHHRRRGAPSTPRSCSTAGTQIVGGVNARKAGTTVPHQDADGTDELPVFGSVAEAMDEDRRGRVGRLRAAGVHQGRRGRGHRRRDPPARRHHRGRARAATPPRSGPTRRAKETRPASSARTAPASSRPGESLRRHHPARHHRQGPASASVSKSGTLTYQMMYELRDIGFSTADRHRRRPDHRHHAHRRARRRSRRTPRPRRS